MKKVCFVLTMLCALLLACKPETEKPTVVTVSVEDVTETTAKVVGQVTADGGAEVTERGVCWNTERNPEITNQRTVDGAGVGTFAAEVADLQPNTTYYVRAYATNEKGTSYGEEMNFTTQETEEPEEPGDDEPENPEEPEEPGDDEPEDPENPEDPEEPGDDEPEEPEIPVVITVTTSEVTDITTNSAVCGGEVTSDGEAVILARGVCYSITQNPTIEDNKTTDGEGMGTFTSLMSDLLPNTTYYVRAYATNEIETIYGDEMSFTTEEETTGIVNGHDWVDLGLPSGLKWATCNVGATAPEQYGDYYSWGEVETKTAYNSNNCSTMYQQVDDFSGDPQYDVARKKWGDAWRMPTKEEQEELLNNCTWELTTINGFSGYKVTGPNGNSIFLPAAGYYYDTYVNFDGYYGGYWSSTPHEDTDSAYYLGFDDKEQRENAYYRSDGQSVRAVIE